MSTPSKKRAPFLREDKGTIGPLFGLMVMPVLITAGAAIDYGKAISQKTELQQALDAAAVALCTRGERDPTEVLRAHLKASLGNMNLNLVDPTSGEGDVELSDPTPNAAGVATPKLNSTVETTLLQFANIDELDIEVQTGVSCGSKRLELSLMLDVTGSMCWPGANDNGVYSCGANSTGNKLASMKEAVEDVLDIFEPNLAAGKTKIGLVPFSEAVNVGSLAEDVRGPIANGRSNWPGHQQYRHPDERWRNWYTKNITNCVTGRKGDEAYTDAAPEESYVDLFYSGNGTCNPSAQILPLTSNAQTISTAVQNYSGQGGTAGHIGTAWAWYLLSPEWAHLWPQSGVEPPDEDKLVKATILMTDGDYNREYCEGVKDNENGWCNNPLSSRAIAAELCESMKEAGIVVYTVGFHVQTSNNPSTPTNQERVLKECASDDDKYFFPYDGEELRSAFQEIGRQLAAGQIGEAVIQN